jgi:uncharacterized RDD family membrane protein YckC
VTQAPGLARRLGSMLYESILLFGVWFFAVWVFQFAAGTFQIEGWRRHLLQGFILVVFALYFLWCWLRSGQTLAMKTWRIRLVAKDGQGRITPGAALLRFLCAVVLVPTGISFLSVAFDRDRQFLHDRIAGTLLISV